MKFALSFICPPLGLYWSHKPLQAILAIGIESLALATWSIGVGPVLHAICIFWALNTLTGKEQEAEVKAFVERGKRKPIHL